MNNKFLAIFGIGAYVLSVIATATDLEGNPKFPFILIIISGIATIIFLIMATIRLWKIKILASVLLIFFAVLVSILSLIIDYVSPSDGSPLILLFNITKLLDLLVIAWVVWILWTTPKMEG